MNIKERPILFNGEMVRAILDGRKTQTRRVMKIQPKSNDYQLLTIHSTTGPRSDVGKSHWALLNKAKTRVLENDDRKFKSPYGYAGDRLWVRETFQSFETCPPSGIKEVVYRSDGKGYGEFSCDEIIWRPSIHMPRWASRITLEITNVLVERLQDISEEDARAEGINCYPFRPDEGWPICDGYTHLPNDGKCPLSPTASEAFRSLWESINGPESWEANPFVWVIEFKRVE